MSDFPILPSTPSPAPVPAPGPGGNRMAILVTVAAAVLVVGASGVAYSLKKGDDQPLTGGTPTVGGECGAVITRPTDRNQQHRNAPTPITYADAPPSFGEHRPEFPPFGRSFYGADRPEVGNLVHTMEHGYTIAWYDDTAAADPAEMAALEKIAGAYTADHERFIAAPWHGSDGAAFPDGKHIALTRWSADPKDPGNQAEQRGNWRYCGGVDAHAIHDFFEAWTNAESPEPGIP